MALSLWLSVYTIGGFNGNLFEIFGNNGKFVKIIKVHLGLHNLFVIAIIQTHGTNSLQIGRALGNSKSITFIENKTIISTSFWANKADTCTGGIKLETSKGQTLTHGISSVGLEVLNNDIGSGHLEGFSSCHRGEIDTLAFIFLRPISNIEITNVQYAALLPNSTIISSTFLQATRKNNSKDYIMWKVANSVKITNTAVWELLAFDRFGGPVRVRAGISGIVSGNDTFYWEVGSLSFRERSESHPNRHKQVIDGILKPGQKIGKTSTVQVRTTNVPFKSNVKISPNSNASLSYSKSSKLKITQYKYPKASIVNITVKDFHSEEPFPNNDGKVLIKSEKGPARKDNDGKLVARKDLEA